MIKASQHIRGVVGLVRRGRFELGKLLQAAVGGGAALGGGLVALTAQVIEDFVTRDAAQPAAEGVLGTFTAKVVQAGSHGLKNFLDNVVGVRFTHAPLLAPVSNQG